MSVNIREISYSNLETGRYGPKSGVSWIIRESWQHCVHVWSLPLWQQQAQHKPGKSKNSTDNFTVTFKMSTKWYYQLPWKGTKQYEGKVCGMSRQSGVAENVYFVTICPFFLEKTSRSTLLRFKFRFTATLTIIRGFSWYIYPMLKTLKWLLNTY